MEKPGKLTHFDGMIATLCAPKDTRILIVARGINLAKAKILRDWLDESIYHIEQEARGGQRG